MDKLKPTQEAIETAKARPNGWVYQIDFEYLPNDYTPPEAVEGAWKVNAKGEIDEVFEPNENYRPIEISNRALPAYMRQQHLDEAGMWILEMDPRCEHLFPEIPKEATVGYWLIGEDGIVTNKFRPSSKYEPDKIAEMIKKQRST